MGNSYAFIEDNKVVIGNDFIERVFSTENNRVVTTEIVNKRIDGSEKIALQRGTAEFYVGIRYRKLIGETTRFICSNDVELSKVNVFKRHVEFVFKPYIYNGVGITFVLNTTIEDDKHYMRKYLEIMIDPKQQKSITLDYIDLEHFIIDSPKQQWTIGDIDKAYLSKYHSALGQPYYINGMFFGSEFPLCENKIKDNMAYSRYYSGKRFDKLNLSCGHTFRTWNTVVGSARSFEHEVIREDFLTYIRDISRNVEPRFQYNSWYDHMLCITDENISKSFKEIENSLDKTLVPPLKSYVVDDGFVDYRSNFWSFNEKFPNEFYPASSLSRKFSSNFGVWIGPRGGYNKYTPGFGKNMERAGTGGYNSKSNDVCVSSKKYIENITNLFIDYMDRFDVNYWKLDGFLLEACPSKRHGHMTGGYKDMYQYTEMWEDWIEIFRKMRLHRESQGKDLWINQTSYCNASPWFLQWTDSFWIQNSADIGFIDKTDKAEKLSSKDNDRVLSYRDDRYYDFSVTRDYQFPHEYLYNHDPIYGNTAKIMIDDNEFREYMLMMATRGNAFWELYYSYNMFNDAKWRINSDALRFIRNEYNILKTSRYIGGTPAKGQVYGYSAWTKNAGIVSLRNPANKIQEYKIKLDRVLGTFENTENLKRSFILPYEMNDSENIYKYGDEITIKLEPLQCIIMKFSCEQERKANFLYGRFDSEKELLLYFDDRIYIDEKLVSSDNTIEKIELLEDYSTLKITFANAVEKAFVSLTYKNAFGDCADVSFTGEYYKDFKVSENKIPSSRDFTIDFAVKCNQNGTIINVQDVLKVSVTDGKYFICFGDVCSTGETEVSDGQRLTVVCEPNGLCKLYVDAELECSSYMSEVCNKLNNASVDTSKSVSDLKVYSKAYSYSDIENL